jgi:hypothetical protein
VPEHAEHTLHVLADLGHSYIRRQWYSCWINIAFAIAFSAIEPKELDIADKVAKRDGANHGWSYRGDAVTRPFLRTVGLDATIRLSISRARRSGRKSVARLTRSKFAISCELSSPTCMPV